MRLYRYTEAALVRAATLPNELELPPRPEVSGLPDVDAPRWRDWVEQVWNQQAVAEAVEVASPVLARRIRAVCGGEVRKPQQVCRVGLSLARYVLRLQHRATPFGLFAGVASARMGAALAVRWGEEHHVVARADAVWLAEMLARLETCPDLLRRLPVMADPTCFVRGDRLVVPCRQPTCDSPPTPGETSVRHTRAVQLAMAAASSPVPAGELVGTLTTEYPDTQVETIEALLTELVASRILLSSLRPPMTVTDPLEHVLEQLDAADADDLPALAPVVEDLRSIRSTLLRHTEAVPESRRALRYEAHGRMAAHSTGVEQPVGVDTQLDCSLTLPRQVGHEAEHAADVLARLAPFPAGTPAWLDYHARFLDRYGPRALVPALQLTDPDIGLDFPAGYRGSLLPRPEQGVTARDEQLLALAQRAAIEGDREIVLTDALVDELAQGRKPAQSPHIDLCFELHAPTRSALQRGEFTLAVAGLAPAAGATAGRFLPLFEVDERERLKAVYAGLPTVDEDAVRAQVSSPPLHVRTENVSRTPVTGSPVISVAEHRGEQALPLEDLAVGADADRMYLVSTSTGTLVEPTAMSAVEQVHFTHPLARLLCELPRAHSAAIGPFSWGAARRLPFLPRLRYGRTVLAPATWRLDATDLAGSDADLQQWHESLARWRKRFGAPETVQVGSGDQRLLLTLNHSSEAQLLRAELNRAGSVVLSEAPEAGAYGWFDGRAHEITLSLASTRLGGQSRPSRPPTETTVVGQEHGHLPGAENSVWASIKLYGHPERHHEILTRHVPELLERFESPPQWWYVRYRDPQPHLRLRLHTPAPTTFAHVATQVGTWAAELRRRRLLGRIQWDTYYPETGRYGTGAAMTAAEAVFAADSAATLAQLALTNCGSASPQALTAAGLMDLAISWFDDITTATRWLLDHITSETALHPTRELHREAMRLTRPHDDFAALRCLPGGQKVTTAWAARREALVTYRSCLAAGDQPPPEIVLPSLMHIHHLRVAGLDTEDEGMCHRLARSAALAWTARGEQA